MTPKEYKKKKGELGTILNTFDVEKLTEYMKTTDLFLVEALKHCDNCKYHHITGCVFEDKKECDWKSKVKWELCK